MGTVRELSSNGTQDLSIWSGCSGRGTFKLCLRSFILPESSWKLRRRDVCDGGGCFTKRHPNCDAKHITEPPIRGGLSDRVRVTLVLFRRRALGDLSGAKQRIGARVRKSRQKEAAGAADAGLMQIEWGEGEVLKLAEVGRSRQEMGRGGPGNVAARIDGGKRCDRGREAGIGSESRADSGGAR